MNLKEYIKHKLSEYLIEYDEPCLDCDNIPPTLSKTLNEQTQDISLNMKFHVEKQLPLCESVFRVGSETYVNLYKEARQLTEQNMLVLKGNDKWLLENTDIGKTDLYENKIVSLDVPYVLNEAEYQGKKVQLGKPKRGGPKKYYVFVKDPKTKRIKKVTFGYPGMSAKIGNKKLAQAFAKRHRCTEKKDRTKASYWSCNLPRYASILGLGKPASRYW
jgi:hypothetical protein